MTKKQEPKFIHSKNMKENRYILSFIIFLLGSLSIHSQTHRDLRTTVEEALVSLKPEHLAIGEIKLDTLLLEKGNKLVVQMNDEFSYLPFRKELVKRAYDTIRSILPPDLKKKKLFILTDGYEISELIPFADNRKRFEIHCERPIVSPIKCHYLPTKGLLNRHIALWQSHGYYFEQSLNRWEWQRARIFETVEDLYTQSFVMPFLTPMLQNAGAYVFSPRERDTNRHELIADNDNADTYFETGTEKVKWENGSTGFAHTVSVYTGTRNPFDDGSFRQTKTTTDPRKEIQAHWYAPIPQTGKYAVYIAYRTVKNSTDDALYTVYHKGGKTQFKVNQSMGGGTWIYLGHFDFAKGENAHVELSNLSRKNGKTVTADAVKIGGGYGNIARRVDNSHIDENPGNSSINYSYTTSGYPRFTEAARYWLQWAGIPDSIYSKSAFRNDYQDDIYARPRWVNYLKEQTHIPIDMAFAFHSDAGTTPDDSIIGTLGIYMSKSNNGIYTNRKSREIARNLTDMIQTQILSDVRKVYNPQWSRRGMWNQSYIEARIPDVPTMLLELLSHQNFADMRYGLDPRFRFLICRAIYKGMLRYICFQNKQEPIVQPLPPDRLYTELVETNKVRIGWKAVQDTLEESASPTAYILYSRKDSGGFDNGTLVKGEEIILPIEAGIIHSYKVAAVNKGGISFPSEIVSVYRSPKGEKDKTVLIVNGFDRISGPASFESTADSLAGFLYAVDRGVPYLNDIAFIGDQFEFRRSATWNSNDNNGHGDSYNNYAGQVIAGNTFDYPFIHGQAMAGTGYSFVSCSHKSLAEGVVKPDTYPIIDLILGKQRQPVITPVLQDTLRSYLAQGGNLLVSGTNLFSDSWGNAQDRTFVEEVLKGKLASRNASKEGIVNSCASPYGYINGRYTFRTRPNPICYSIESVDGVLPADKLAHTILRYPENNIGAGIVYEGKYRTCSLGFPFEALQTPSERNRLMESILRFFSIQQQNKIQYIQ